MARPNEYEQGLLDAFTEAVNALPGVHLTQEHVGPYDEGFDGVALFELEGKKPKYFALEVKKNLFPRDLPQIVWSIKKYRTNHMGSNNLLVLLADTISTGAKEWLQNERVGYYDSSGSLFVPTDDAYILIDRPPTRKQTKTTGSVFEGRRSLVIETLWEVKDRWTGVKEIAKRIEASSSMVSETLTELERRGWVDAEGSGPAKVRRLVNWASLLDEWTNHETAKGEWSLERYYVPNIRPEPLAEKLGEACDNRKILYEITGEWAGNQYTPHLSNVSQLKVRMAEAGVRSLVLNAVGAKPVTEGWNLGIISAGPGQEMRFADRATGIALASPLRTYLDLLRSGGRAKEQAKELRNQWLTIQ